MKKIYCMFCVFVIIGLFNISIVSAQTNYPTPMASTEVMQALKNDLNGSGLWSTISLADGFTFTSESAGVSFDGFMALGSGAPGIKLKKLTGTSAAVGSSVSIAHGLDKSKILGIQVLVSNDSGNRIPPNFTSVANHEFDFFVDTNDVTVYNISANSSNIDGNDITVLITYEE